MDRQVDRLNMDKQKYMMYFMKNDRNSLGVKSLEGLERETERKPTEVYLSFSDSKVTGHFGHSKP